MYARISAALVTVALVMTGLASAQERFGTLQGRVTDQQGAPVPGVTVTVTNIETGENKVYVTDANGQWVALDLNPGRYNVAFELAGFARVERPDISVMLGRGFELNAQMRVGQLTETVQVTAEATPLVDTRSTLIATTSRLRSSTACRRAVRSSQSRSPRRRSMPAKSKAASR